MVSTGETVLTTTNLAEGFLRTLFEKVETSQVIIDGLDECNSDQRKLILAFFTDVVRICDEREPGRLRVMFLSQDYGDIQKSLLAASSLKLTERENEPDIAIYVQHRTSSIPQNLDLELSTKEIIKESVCGRARGMFLYAKLVMNHICGLDTKEAVLNELNSYGFPDGLEEAYERIIKRLHDTLSPAQWKSTRKLMGWLVCAKRPLRWREVQAAFSMDAGTQTFDFDKRRLSNSIQHYCGSLIQVLSGDCIELVHTTAKIHIASSEYISKSAVECDLASLCLRYLTFDIFDPGFDEERLKSCIRAGDLSFQDYAIAKWMEHIQTIITNKSCISPHDENENSRSVDEVHVAVNEFALRYEKDILECEMTDRAEQDCEPFHITPCYESLMNIWNLVCQHASMGSSAKNDISIKELGSALTRSREILEKITAEHSPHSPENEKLRNLYGDRLFKCPKVTCYYFHEGFKGARTRDHHINRHDRPFSCSFPDCSIVEFGFTSNKDLEKHRKFFHPDTEEQANSFSSIVKPTTATPFQCNICQRRFTWSFIHKNHLLSHTGTRPHACSECGKAFTRANDCRRHEKIHSKRR
ncbi:hypothetical protein ONS95_001443 [Cadophora gregata]|uniref:uncharacterized protein n=1 Tax=Cadophora gregata TaxID=51156 RepID=UPI0026DC0954|nr:uncharacterized protein ONS95_001443 [Cadophora gregata]KAK0111063.1 hypothetical protein ONS95_001443 [Cadophora gregata]